MATRKKPRKKPVRTGKTPQKQITAETPQTTAPTSRQFWWGKYGYWLGDSERRYGRLTSSRSIPAHTKLEMLRDPVIALAMGFISATLVKAKRVIECSDESKRRFFEAMFRAWEQEYILKSAMAIALGSCGLIKRFQFAVPETVEIAAPPVWTSAATPYIIEGFDAVYPIGSSAVFDDKGRQFQGMSTPDGKIDVFYSLWIVMGQARAFGAYAGSGRLENVYRDWWLKSFGRDLYLVWLQKCANPVVAAGFPPGKTEGTSHQDIAIQTGDAMRSGATVAIPSTVYENVDTLTGDERLSAVRQWTLEFLESHSDIGQFHQLEDHADQKISLGMLVPPQAYLNVKQSALGGPTTADVLTRLAANLLMIDAAYLDQPLNDYVFPVISRANFPPSSPRVRVRTVGLDTGSKKQLYEIVKMLLGRMDTDTSLFDLLEGLKRLGMPVASMDLGSQEDSSEGLDRGRGLSADDDDEDDESSPSDPPIEVLEQMTRERISPVEERDTVVDDEDIERTMRRLSDVLPEIFGE